MTGPRSSAGGAAAAAGPGFESRILAWFASHLIARVPLPASWRISAAQVEEIGGQTGQEMDDLGAITDRGGYVFIQAKLRLQVGEYASSPLAEALDQAVRQFIDGVPPGPDGTRRRLEPGRDALVICTDAGASAPVRNDLRAVVTRLAGYPQQLPLDQVATNAGERRALKVLLTHLRDAFAKRANGTPPCEEQLREIGRFLHVITLDVESGGPDRIIAETHLRGVLDDPATAPGGWNDLVTLGQSLIEERRWANHDGVRHALRAEPWSGANANAGSPARLLWSYCNVLRDEGLSYQDCLEQLTFLLFLKIADEQAKRPFNRQPIIPHGLDWDSLVRLDGESVEVQYRHILTELGKYPGTLGVVFRKAQNKIQDPARLRRLVVDLTGQVQWMTLDADVKGEAYEALLAKNAEDIKSGAGQYFTPRPLIQAIVDVMRPAAGMRVCDPRREPAGSWWPPTRR